MSEGKADERFSQARASILVATTGHSRVDVVARALLDQSVPIGGSELVIANGRRARRILRRLERVHAMLGERLPLQILETSRSARAHALNAAADAARNDLLIFIADDFVPTRLWLETHLRLHASRPQASVVGVGPAHFEQSLRRSAFRRWLEDSGRLFGAPLVRPGARMPRDFFYGANTSLKRSLFRAAGGFDEAFRYDTTDDGELGFRLRDLGAEVVYLEAAGALHEHALTLVGRCRQMVNAGRSAAVLQLRHPSIASLHLSSDALGPVAARRSFGGARPEDRLRAARELLWHRAQSACFACGYRWSRRALALAGGAGALPPAPRSSPEDALGVEFIREIAPDREWEATVPITHVAGLEVCEVFDGHCIPDTADSVAFFNPDGSAQAYFRLTRPHDFGGRKVEVAVEVLADTADDALHIEYDSTDDAVQVVGMAPGAFKSTPAQLLAKSGEWTHVRFVIDDPRFCPSINGADFRIVSRRSRGTPLRLRRVGVSVRSRRNGAAKREDGVSR